MKNIIQKVTASGAVIKDGKILILQRAQDDDIFPGLWELPSGKKEPRESVYDAVVREIKEETDVDVMVLDIIFTFNFEVEKPDEIKDFTQLVFLVEPVGDANVKISNEHQDFKWVSKEDLDNYNLSKETKEAINKAFEKKWIK